MHCHDWPTAEVTWADLDGARSVFTIHNLNYGADLIGRAMAASAVGTTVSPTYAAEVCHEAHTGCSYSGPRVLCSGNDRQWYRPFVVPCHTCI